MTPEEGTTATSPEICGALLDKCRAGTREEKERGDFKRWDVLQSAQGPRVTINGKSLVMLASNNYLNLFNRPQVREAVIRAVEQYGCGMAGGRTLCGTNVLHEQLEQRLARISGHESAILYHSCFAANVGVISTLVGPGDLIFSDQLNHASLIDGCRLSRASIQVYPHVDVGALARLLEQAKDKPGLKMVVTDGVFSFDGDIAPMPDIVAVARKYGAFVVCDEAHAAGTIGATGRGTPEYFGLYGKMDVVTGTLGKALGGTLGGYVASHPDVIDFLIQNCRNFIFTNALPPQVVAANIAVLDLLRDDPSVVRRLHDNAVYFRKALSDAGFELLGGGTPVIPVLIRDTERTMEMGRRLFDEGVFAPGFGYPVTPKGMARIRTIMCADHAREDLEFAARAFAKIGRELGVI